MEIFTWTGLGINTATLKLWHKKYSPSPIQRWPRLAILRPLRQTRFVIHIQDAKLYYDTKINRYHIPQRRRRRGSARRLGWERSGGLSGDIEPPSFFSWLQSNPFFCSPEQVRGSREASAAQAQGCFLHVGHSRHRLVAAWVWSSRRLMMQGGVYQLIREVRPRVIKYTWLAPPWRTEAKKTCQSGKNWNNIYIQSRLSGFVVDPCLVCSCVNNVGHADLLYF